MIRIFLPLICAALGFAAASCSQSDGPLAPAEAPASPQSTSHDAAAAAMPSTSPQAQDPSELPAAVPPAAGRAASGPQPVADQTASGSPPDPNQTAATTSQSTAEAKPDASTGTPAERRASTLIGMPVVSADGSPLGDVKDIIFDPQGRAAHLVIAYGSQSEPGIGQPSDDVTPASTPDGKLTAMPWDAAVASMKDGRLVLDGAKLQNAPSFTADAWPNLEDPAWSVTTDAYWRKAVQAAIAAHPGAPIDSTARQRGRRSRDGSGSY